MLAGRLGMGAMLSVNVYNTFLAVGLAQLAGSLGDIGNAVASLQRYVGVASLKACDPLSSRRQFGPMTYTAGIKHCRPMSSCGSNSAFAHPVAVMQQV